MTHPYKPTPAAVAHALSGQPGGAFELFMVACNLETDIDLDTRLAASHYKPEIQQKSTVKKEGEAATHPFSVPIQSSRVKKEEES